MKLQLLPSTFESDGRPSNRQHLTCIVVDDCVAFDAGSLAMACSEKQKESIRDVVISHAHLDHIAGLPLFIDDLFATLSEPVRIYGLPSVIDVLETHVFNWRVYPKFSELHNESAPVMEYVPFDPGREISVRHLKVTPVEVNHKVPSCGFFISDGSVTIATTGDTAPTEVFWESVNNLPNIAAVLVECAFPDRLSELASISYHLTPATLETELAKFGRDDAEVYVVNLKPSYREEIVGQLSQLNRGSLKILEVGRTYKW